MATYKIRLSDWMADLPNRVQERPLNMVAIPGSHDSLTNAIDKSAAPSPDLEKCLAGPYNALPGSRFILSPFFRKWCKTQAYDALEQLNAGIRYFDLRVAPKKNGEIAVVHGLYSSVLDPTLRKINVFLESHTSELVILDFQHFYDFTPVLHQDLINTLKSTFTRKICPKMNNATVSLYKLIEANHRVLIIYREDDYSEIDPMLCNGEDWPTAWPNTMSAVRMIEFAESRLTNRAKTRGFITQLILTPDGDAIKRDPLAGVKHACAERVFPAANKWLNEKARKFDPCVIISDFVDMKAGAFCKNAIAVNFETSDSVNFVQ